MGRRYARAPDSVESGVIVPMPSRLVQVMKKSGFFHVV